MVDAFKEKEQWREKVEKSIEDTEFAEKIKVDKDLLEYLLFEELIIDSEKGIKVKLPVWSGTFLRKIDLSEVDFEDVHWGCYFNHEFEGRFTYDWDENNKPLYRADDNFCDAINEMLDKKWDEKYLIDYSGTNARIDLSKSFAMKHSNYLGLDYCNFSGVDLSTSNIESIRTVSLECSDISNTHLSFNSVPELYGRDSSFEGIDLSMYEINAYEYLTGRDGYYLDNCNLNDTGAKIIFDIDDFESGIDTTIELAEALHKKWIGCKIDVISTKREKDKLLANAKPETGLKK